MKAKLFLIALLVILLKTDLSAQQINFEWANKIGGNDGESIQAIAVDQEGNVFCTGAFGNDTVDFDPGGGIYNLIGVHEYGNIFVAKYNGSGQLLWAKYIGNGGGTSIKVDGKGNSIITGSFRGVVDFDPGNGEFNLSAEPLGIFVLKLNKDGNFIWAKGFRTGGGTALSNDKDGNIVIIGQFEGTSDFDPSPNTFNLTASGINDNFVSKLDSNGNFIWAKQFGSSSYDEITSVAIDSFGDIYVGGNFQGTVDFDPGPEVVTLNDSDIKFGYAYLLKLNKQGVFDWVHQISQECRAITVDKEDKVICTGRFTETVDFDPSSNVMNLTSNGKDDIFILKMDRFGKFMWARSIGGASNDIINSVITDNSNNIYTTGSFYSLTDFDPSGEKFELSPVNRNDIFLSKFDSFGSFQWAKQFGGEWNEEGTSVANDGLGNVYTAGYFRGDADFNPGDDTYILRPMGDSDMFLVKLSQGTVGVTDEFLPVNDFTIFPNPTSNLITIELPFKNLHEKINISIYSIEGILLKEYSENIQQKLHINLSNQPVGMYFIKLSSGTESFISKVSIIK